MKILDSKTYYHEDSFTTTTKILIGGKNYVRKEFETGQIFWIWDGLIFSDNTLEEQYQHILDIQQRKDKLNRILNG